MSNTQAVNLSNDSRDHKTMSNAGRLEVGEIPLALYIHIPWCVKKCPYCDFNSHELPADTQLSMYDEYVDALLADAAMQQPLSQGRAVSSIFHRWWYTVAITNRSLSATVYRAKRHILFCC